ncbi:MAG: hypothetical protein A2X48_04840 [Lentisphaerae bacterium GWF2_49_21]|nr:MAG: hypothetical protein A2X48_04840 [Lentisphaerae bacterium GWF2_49_21]
MKIKIPDSLLKKYYVDWGCRWGLTRERLMQVIYYMYADSPNIHIGKRVYMRSLQTIGSVHPDSSLSIGDESVFWGKSNICASYGGQISIGSRSLIGDNNNTLCRNRVSIGNYVLTAQNLSIRDYEDHPIPPRERKAQVSYCIRQYNPFHDPSNIGLSPEEIEYFDTYWNDKRYFVSAPVEIGDNCWIGHDVTIMKGVNISENSIIAARSVVTKSVPPNCIAGGVPARVLRENLDQDDPEEFWKNRPQT